MERTLVVLAGPTASGKTACGIELAEHFSSEIISADSRQIYKEPRIGTAVPTPEELSRIRHHFIQVVSLTDPFTASRFEFEGLDLLEQLFQNQKLIFLVGGSGLYIDALCTGIDDLPSADPAIRQSLHERLALEGLPSLAEELKRLDPLSHSRVDLHNPLRVMKALEVSLQTGKPYSSFLTSTPKKRPFRMIRIALDMDRNLLYDRINRRVDRMMEDGLLKEVEGLKRYRDLTPMKSVGYRELFRHLDGELSLEEAVDLIKRNTRKYARKQLTWFRKNGNYRWFEPGQTSGMIRYIKDA
jgi:tRNA dimethylallyltransferase